MGASTQRAQGRCVHRNRQEPDGAVRNQAASAMGMSAEYFFGPAVVDWAVVVGKAVMAAGPHAPLRSRPVGVLQNEERLRSAIGKLSQRNRRTAMRPRHVDVDWRKSASVP